MIQQTRNRRRRGQAGVTLIEMLVVVVIMGLFVALVGPKLWSNVDKAKVTAAHAEIQQLVAAAGTYKLDKGNFPTTEEGLAALRPYMSQDVPKDPWNNDYIYKFPGDHGDEPDIISLGADGQPGGDGVNADVVSWKAQ